MKLISGAVCIAIHSTSRKTIVYKCYDCKYMRFYSLRLYGMLILYILWQNRLYMKHWWGKRSCLHILTVNRRLNSRSVQIMLITDVQFSVRFMFHRADSWLFMPDVTIAEAAEEEASMLLNRDRETWSPRQFSILVFILYDETRVR